MEFLAKGTVARIISAWRSASQRGLKRTAAEADQIAGGLPRTLPNKKHLDLIRAHNKLHKELREKDVPYAGCVENKLEQLESDDFVAPPLSEVACRDEGSKEERIIPQLTAAGTIVQKKYATVKVPMPATTEELRYRLKLESTSWELARLEQPHNNVIAHLSRDDWQDHLDFVLGDKVLGKAAKTADGSFTFKAPWELVLEYEYQLRKNACYLVNTSDPQLSMAAALQKARADQELKEEHFLTPLGLSAGAEAAFAASSSSRGRPGRSPARRSKTPPLSRAAKRQLRAAAKKAARSDPPVPVTKTQPGQDQSKDKGAGKRAAGKCFKFNRGNCKDGKKCKWSHSCSLCEKPGCAAWKHDEAAKKKTG